MKLRTKKMLPKLLASGAAALSCMVGLCYVVYQSVGVVVADEHGCYPGIAAPQTVVIVDVSPPRFDNEQITSLRNYVVSAYKNLRFNEAFKFFTTEPDVMSSVANVRFWACGQTADPSVLEEYGLEVAQSGYLERQKERLYEKVLAPELAEVFTATPDEARLQNAQSPIFEMVKSIARDEKLKSGDHAILASDLIQNSPDGVSFCRVQNDMPPFEIFRQREIYKERLAPPSLEGVELTILMLIREGYGQGTYQFCKSEEEIKKFWRDFFEANGASVDFIRIRQGVAL